MHSSATSLATSTDNRRVCLSDCNSWLTRDRDASAMTTDVEMDKIEVAPRPHRFRSTSRAVVAFKDLPSHSASPGTSNYQRRRFHQSKYMRSLRHYLTGETLPRESLYRNPGSVHHGRTRPTVDQLRNGELSQVSTLLILLKQREKSQRAYLTVSCILYPSTFRRCFDIETFYMTSNSFYSVIYGFHPVSKSHGFDLIPL